ncbi:MAG: valine--tRNA ligase [Candidatus Saelkia tenebricola]|nr:valine--tRNA ligase [Candidatus Saelkia tenebricola]
MQIDEGTRERKNLSRMESRYQSKKTEQKWYDYWEKGGFFHVEPDLNKPPFCIVIPPPNVTGILHMGHALNNTIQDILIRWKRMQGYCVLWIPGTDHAGIATQNVVEREIFKEGLTRYDLGREKFIKKIWQWRNEYGSTIVKQLRKLGASCDWERERFTMDEGLSEAVLEAFIKLYNKGVIYKGNYIINWCPRCRTALSDEEVEHEEQEGFLYYLKYPVINAEGKFVTVATTRPETMLGDVAVAVHPNDERYEFLKGKKILLPLINRELQIVRDDAVDLEFGTGAVKITPAHDVADFEIALRHNLKPVVIMDDTGKMNENAIHFKGMDRFKARKEIIKELESQDLVEKTEPYVNSVGHCYRCHTVVEPYISWQWFVKMKPLAQPGIKMVKDGEIKILPSRWEKVYLHWMENIRDWCISRQIWWGHRIPVYYCENCWEGDKENSFEPQDVSKLKGVMVSKEQPLVCPDCGGKNIIQDEDVLDTWFSSWLWPFSAMGWPKEDLKLQAENSQLNDLAYFYPTSTLVTAQEILFFWVARMIMAGLEFTGEVPFRDVYIHGTVRDDKGRKMSKSLGNAIDPLGIIDEYGADALRFSLISITSVGQDVFLSKDKFIFGRNFTNKIWNAARFLISNLDDLDGDFTIENFSLFDGWILNNLNNLIAKMNRALEEYSFNEAANLLYEFFWHQFCDWYIELKKKDLYSEDRDVKNRASVMLIFVLDNLLRLLHPFMPFISEDIWQKLKVYLTKSYEVMGLQFQDTNSLMLASWPKEVRQFKDEKSKDEMEDIIAIIQCIRNIRSELNVPPSKKTALVLVGERERLLADFKKHSDYLMPLAQVSSLEVFSQDINRPANSAFGAAGGLKIYILLEGVIDLEQEKKRLEKKEKGLGRELKQVQKKLENKDFLNKANPEVVLKTKQKEQSLKVQLKDLVVIINNL